MAIVKQQPMAALYGRAAAITGEAQKAQREIEMNRRAAEQMQALQIQRAREERSQQRQLEAEERSHQWEVEKMEMRSRADFAEEERERQEKRAKLKIATKRIDELVEAGHLTQEAGEKHKARTVANYYGASISERALFPEMYKSKEESPMMASMRAKMGDKAAPTAEQLRANLTPEAHKMGVELGYWSE